MASGYRCDADGQEREHEGWDCAVGDDQRPLLEVTGAVVANRCDEHPDCRTYYQRLHRQLECGNRAEHMSVEPG